MRPNQATRKKIEQVRQHDPRSGRIAVGERSIEHADNLARLEQNQVERQLRDPCRETDDEEAATEPDGAQRRLRVGSTDDVENEVEALDARPLLELLCQQLCSRLV